MVAAPVAIDILSPICVGKNPNCNNFLIKACTGFFDLATAAATDAGAVKGISGYDSADFAVTANGWVQLATKQYVTSIGNASATSYTVTHNLNSKDVMVQLYDVSSDDTVIADVVRTSVDVVTVDFSTAPATNDIRVLVQKIG